MTLPPPSTTATTRSRNTKRVDKIRADKFTWEDIFTATEIMDWQGIEMQFAVDQLVPQRRITLLYAPEKSCKSLLAYYWGKCIANQVSVFGKFTSQRMPVIYFDYEDGLTGEYIKWMQGLGAEDVRVFNLYTGIPGLESDALLKICRELKPVLILDSLHKIIGRYKLESATNSAAMERVLEIIRQLCVAGATVILIHHSTKDDPDQYRDSGVIGADVDAILAAQRNIVKDGSTHLRLQGKPSRGFLPPTLELTAFPALIKEGKFVAHWEQSNLERVVEFVSSQGEAGTTLVDVRRGVRNMRTEEKDKAVNEAVKLGLLLKNEGRIFKAPACPATLI